MLQTNFLSKISKPAIGIAILLTVNFCISLVASQWFEEFCIFPDLTPLAWILPHLLTFWFVSREHIVHWLFILAIVIMDRLIRDSWSSLETGLFVSVTNLLSASALVIFYWIVGCSPGTSISGNAALIAAVTVVACQFDADRFLIGYNNTGLKSRHGFFVGFVLFLFASLLGAMESSSFLLYINGFVFSWFYLRFLQHHPQRKYGDHRNSFALAKFFPGPLEKWVAVPSNLIYHTILRSKLCPAIERQSEIVSTASFAADIPGITSDADRHRRIALKALNERLFNRPTQPSDATEWPNLDESGSAAPLPNAQVQSEVVVLTGLDAPKPPVDSAV